MSDRRLVVVIGGSPVEHTAGDIHRDKDDFFWVDSEDNEYFAGSWVTGFGFVNVRVRKEHTRLLTHLEADRLSLSRIRIGSQPSMPIQFPPSDVEPGWEPKGEADDQAEPS